MLARTARATATASARSSSIAGHGHLRCTPASASASASPISSVKSTTQPSVNVGAEAKRCASSVISSVYTDKAYKPIPAFSHYSQAIKTTHGASTIYLSGQIPSDKTGTLITGSVAEKTGAIIENTESILKEAGSGLDGVVKVVVYVKDAEIMPEFAKVYDAAFLHKSARSMVVVETLPAGVDVQVDLWLFVKCLDRTRCGLVGSSW
ncbi:Endoribonuclease L-PSP-domain-containing protein [Aspergillus undulatus]|uniref:Endoribonuclease L-PSP-domain-containing protein n=1 Tax=Aspergillus undulatus TaxID=1810928 RepID=UPI003CCD53D5